jgi:DNA-binding MarR family transcriptional regulator
MNWATSARAILVRPGGPVRHTRQHDVGQRGDHREQAGYVRRERDPRDRRRVVIRLVLETALRDVAAVFLPMMRDWQQMAARYSDDELRLIVDFYDRMEQVLRGHLTRLREAGQDPG